MGCEESEVIKGLFDVLKCRVHRVECLVTGSELKPNQQAFNTVVCVHNKEIDQENQLLRFAAVLDVEQQVSFFENYIMTIFLKLNTLQGLIIHVVEHSSSDGMQSTSVYELHRTGRNMTKQYEKLKKGNFISNNKFPFQHFFLFQFYHSRSCDDSLFISRRGKTTDRSNRFPYIY